MAKKYGNSSPDKDAGWGLIYRLNNLWAQVDPKATSGDFDGWNFVLDRIYCNLLYEDNMIVTRIYECGHGHKFSSIIKRKECPECLQQKKVGVQLKIIKIEKVELSEEDEMIYKHLTRSIAAEKNNIRKAVKTGHKQETKIQIKIEIKSLEQAREDYYLALMMKDIWLRKFMQSKGLYLKVVTHDPSNALFGR